MNQSAQNRSNGAGLAQCLELIRPKACRHELIRVGGAKDGAYLLPDDVLGIGACFSPGVNNVKDFEDELTRKYGVKCHMCDFTSDPSKFGTPLIENMQTFEKKWLDIDGGADSITLDDWVSRRVSKDSGDLILQMDIEGAEYRNLLAMSEETLLRFRIILVELHNLYALSRADEIAKTLWPTLEKLDSSHVCVHAHPNNCGGEFVDRVTGMNLPSVIELTYLRRDRNSVDSIDLMDPKLPHPLDISRNVISKPPVHLNERWLMKGFRPAESQIKMLSDQLDFANWRISEYEKNQREYDEDLQSL